MDRTDIPSGFSFTFSRKAQTTKVDKSKIQVEDEKCVPETEYIHLVEGKEILSNKEKEEVKELVIPLITKNVWRLPKRDLAIPDGPLTIPDGPLTIPDGPLAIPDGPLAIEEQALKEIILDGKLSKEKEERKPTSNASFVIPLLLQNKIPEGFETDNRLDVSLRPDPSSLDDYEEVPVEQFGLAALRGMGWKPGGGIGRTNKRCVAPVEVTVRPRGLGLGASSKDLDSLKAQAANREFPLVVGACICVMEGNSKGQYGEIQSLDEATGRVVVKLSQNDHSVTLPEVFLKAVSKEEFEKESKVINSTSHVESSEGDGSKGRKRKHKSTLLDTRGPKRSPSDTDTRGTRRSPSDSGTRGRIYSPSDIETRRHKTHSPSTEKRKKKKKKEREHSPKTELLWLHPKLRMRIIDKDYKKGHFFKSKVMIEDVTTPTTCVCRTEKGDILEGIESWMLETVIPKLESSYVMIVQGRFRGKVGRILSRDRENCLATVQLLPDQQDLVKFSYDSICEFVGDPSSYE